MSASLALMHAADASPLDRAAAFQALREMVLNSVASEHSKRNYAKALDEVFALCEERKQPFSRALLMEYRAAMLEKKLSASTVNVRLSAVRKLIGEAQRNGIIGAEEAANVAGVPNLSQKGTRLGNWLTREQAKELLTVPDRSKIKGKRDYAILALLLGCALRRQELASLDVDGIQMREGRWVLPDLCGKGGRVCTVAIPLWVKHGIDAWMIAAKIEDGRLLRPLSKSGKLIGEELGDDLVGRGAIGKADWNRTLRRPRPAPDLRKALSQNGGDLEQIKFLLGHSSIQTTERYLGSEQDLVVPVNDNLGL